MQQELRRSQDNDHVGSSRVRRKFGQSSEVLREQIREVHDLAKEACRNSPSGSSQSPGVCRKSAEASLRVHRMIDGSSPETRRKKRLTHRSIAAEVVLELFVVSTMIKLENGR